MTDTATSLPAPPSPAGPAKPANVFGVIALVLALISFLTAVIPLASGFAWLTALPAIVLAIIGLTRRGRPKRLALAGLIVGAVAWLVSIVVTIVTVVIGVGAIDDLPVPEAAVSDGETVALGQPVTNSDGVTFTLDAVTCGLVSTGSDYFDEKPTGEWCRIDYTVANGGDASVSLLGSDVTANAGSTVYSADDATGRFGDDYFTTDVNPGLSAGCVVFVDVPQGTRLDSIAFAPVLSFAEPVLSSVG